MVETILEKAVAARIPFWKDFHLCAAKVSLRSGETVDVSGVGRGQSEALMRATGEAVETLSLDLVPAELPPVAEDATKLGGWMGQALLRQKPIWLGFAGLGAADDFAAPVFLSRSLDEPPLSEGAAAGQTLADAQLSGLYELIERDAVACWWGSGKPANLIEDALVQRSGLAPRRVLTLDLSAGAIAPVCGLISLNTEGLGFVFASAARSSFAEARAAAMRELAQQEVAEQVVRRRNLPSNPLYPATIFARVENNEDVVGPLTEDAPIAIELEPAEAARHLSVLLQASDQSGLTIGCIDLSRDDLPIKACKIASPDLQPSRLHLVSDRLSESISRWGAPVLARKGLALF